MTLEYLIEKYIEKTGYGMDMWSKEENSVMTTVAEIIEESKVNKISSNTLLADSCPNCGQSPCLCIVPLGN
jgi:AMMECR1 domain-containing protein